MLLESTFWADALFRSARVPGGNVVRIRQRRVSVALAALVVLVLCSDAFAWGPATHVKLASDLLSNLWLLPAAVGGLIARHRRYFVYGNVATDTVLAKKMSQVKQVCHLWSTGMSLLEKAETEEGKAFAYGYLAHLAADTVAHNKFLPRQMAVSRSTISFGHLYWEIRADTPIGRPNWMELRTSLRGRYPEPEVLLESHLQSTLLSYRTNRFLFKRMNLLASERSWRKSVEFWSRLSRYPIESDLLGMYHAESLGRTVDVLTNGAASAVLHEDPNGNLALGYARAQRRQLRQMKRARLPHEHIILEATQVHAPSAGAAKILLR
ncbi:MAG TPA: zinc dependent phospholipase C family protein [Phycisphaerae bacterium]|nr:zinc dependent phospholipase C family protein [Phycisphaerae bacterium]